MTVFWKSWILTFWPHPLRPRVVGGVGVCWLLPYCCMSSFPLIWYATWPCSVKVEFWPIDPISQVGAGGSVGKIIATMLLHSWFPLFWYAPWPCSEKVEFWPFDPNPRVRRWGVGRGLRTKYLIHAAAFVIPFNLICNMTMFWKSWIWTHPLRLPRGWDTGLDRKSHLICFIFIVPLPACERPRVLASPALMHCGPWARHIYPSLVLVQHRKTRPCLTERLLMGRKESNQTNCLHAKFP